MGGQQQDQVLFVFLVKIMALACLVALNAYVKAGGVEIYVMYGAPMPLEYLKMTTFGIVV
jgi:hypothetical protein